MIGKANQPEQDREKREGERKMIGERQMGEVKEEEKERKQRDQDRRKTETKIK